MSHFVPSLVSTTGFASPVYQCFRKPSPLRFTRPNRKCFQPIKASSSANLTSQDEIQGLDKNYCDDFVCTSSPAVESTVRSLARDILRANGVYTLSILSRNVEYKEPFRKFSGKDGYSKLNFMTKAIKNASVRITKMQMIDNANAVIDWNVTGTIGPILPIDVDMTTQVTLNLLTGQIEKHTESWSLKKCSPPSAFAFVAARAAWAVGANSAAAAATTGSLLDSLTSMDDEGDGYTMKDPNDPMKFFQQKDTFREDATMFVGFLLLMYVITQAYTQLFKG